MVLLSIKFTTGMGPLVALFTDSVSLSRYSKMTSRYSKMTPRYNKRAFRHTIALDLKGVAGK